MQETEVQMKVTGYNEENIEKENLFITGKLEVRGNKM